MAELTFKQQKFVIALLDTGGTNETRAALLAGYQTGHDVRAVELMRNPRVLAAIREEADKRVRGGAIPAASKLREIANNDTHKDQYKANIELLNRAGLIVQTQHKVIVDDHRSDAEVIAATVALAKFIGFDAKKALASVGIDYVDAEFSEVPSGKTVLEKPRKTRTSQHDLPERDDISDLLADLPEVSENDTLSEQDNDDDGQTD